MATKTFIGEIKKLYERNVNGRHGPSTAYSAKIVGTDGVEYPEWVGFGFTKPTCEQGDSVVITAKQEKGFWKAIDVEVTDQQEPSQTSSAVPTTTQDGAKGLVSGASGSTAPAKSSDPQASPTTPLRPNQQQNIHYQNSRTAAISLVDLLLRNQAVPLSGTTGKAGVAKRFEEIQALVNKLTVVLYHDLETHRLVKDIEDVYEHEEATALPGDFDGEEEGSDEE
jgi:hypothetical protein